MRLRTALPFLAVAAVACSDSTAPRTGIVGRWSASVGGSPPSSWTLTFGADGSYVSELRGPGDLPDYSRADGTYRVAGDSLYVRLARVVTWNASNGPTSPPTVQTFDPSAEAPPMRFAVAGNALMLSYFTYPDNTRQEATTTFQRTDCVLRPPTGPLPAGCY